LLLLHIPSTSLALAIVRPANGALRSLPFLPIEASLAANSKSIPIIAGLCNYTFWVTSCRLDLFHLGPRLP